MWKRSRRLFAGAAAGVLLLCASPLAAAAPAPIVDAQETQQDFGAAMQRGVAALRAGRADEAADAFRTALELQPGNPSAQTLLASALLQQGDTDAALGLLTTAVDTAPDYYPARNVLGRAYAAAGRADEAIEQLQEAVRLQPEDSGSRALLANLLLQERRLDAAADHAAELVRRHPEQGPVHTLLGTVELHRERYTEALAAYESALELSPDSTLARYGRAASLSGLDRGEEAIPILARLVDEDPSSGDALVLLAELLSDKGVEERLDAIRFYRSALELQPESQRIVRGLADLYLDLGLDVRGIELIGASGDPSDPELQMALGRMLERENQYEQARDAYLLALEAGAGAEAHYRLGITLANLADLEGAEAEFREAVEIDRRHPAAWRELGSILLDRGDAAGAREALDWAVARNTDDSQTWHLAGTAYLRLGDLETAVEHLRTALELDPDNTEALYSLGTTLRQQGQIEESREVLGRLQELRQAEQGIDATEVRGRRADVIVRDAYIRHRIGDHEIAAELFEQVIDLTPAEERAWHYLGLTRIALGEEPAAIEALERAAELNPDRPATWVALAGLYERAGRTEDARRALARAEELGVDQGPSSVL